MLKENFEKKEFSANKPVIKGKITPISQSLENLAIEKPNYVKFSKQFFNSFKLKWYTLLYDTSFVIIAAVLFSLMGVYIQTKSTVLGQGKNPEQIQQMLSTFNQTQLALYMQQLQSFLIIFTILIIIAVVIIYLLFTLSQYMDWNELLNHKFDKKVFWKWNLFHLILLPLIVLWLLIALLIRLGLSFLFSFLFPLNNNISNLLSQGVGHLLLIFSLLILFLISYSFAKEQKIWKALETTPSLFWQNKTKIAWIMLFAFIVDIILSYLFMFLQPYLFSQQEMVSTIIITVIFILFINWLRFFLYTEIHDQHQ